MSLDMFVQRQRLSPEGSSPPFSSPVYVRDRPNASYSGVYCYLILEFHVSVQD